MDEALEGILSWDELSNELKSKIIGNNSEQI